MRNLLGIATVLGLALRPLPTAAQEGERKQVLENVGASTVRLSRGTQFPDREDFTGLLISSKGLVLAPWRKVCLPPPYRGPGSPAEVNATVVGVHPTHDLALVQLDLQGPGARLTAKPAMLSSAPALLGDPLYLIRSSYSKAIPVVVASESESGDHPDYFAVAAARKEEPIFMGTLPEDFVVNLRGEVAGVGTRTVVNAKLVTRFIPVHGLNPDAFIPLSKRRTNPGNVRELYQLSEEATKRKNKPGQQYDPNLPDQGATEFLRLALAEDPTNSETYFRLGMARETFQVNHQGSTPGYLAKGILMDPWADTAADAYWELGKTLYANPNLKASGISVWVEGATKFPTKTAKLWESLAKAYWDSSNFYEAARSCLMVREISGSQGSELHDIYAKSRLRLSDQTQKDLNQFENSISDQIRTMKSDAELAKKASRDFMTAEGKRVVTGESGGPAGPASGGGKSLPDAPRGRPDPTQGKSDDQVEAMFVRSRIDSALEHFRAGRLAVAKGILEDVVANYPKVSDTKVARDLLDVIKEKK